MVGSGEATTQIGSHSEFSLYGELSQLGFSKVHIGDRSLFNVALTARVVLSKNAKFILGDSSSVIVKETLNLYDGASIVSNVGASLIVSGTLHLSSNVKLNIGKHAELEVSVGSFCMLSHSYNLTSFTSLNWSVHNSPYVACFPSLNELQAMIP